MSIRSALLLAAPALLLTGCMKELTGPDCIPKPYTTASTSGDTITTSTGLRYIETQVGLGTISDWCDVVVVHYDAFLQDGTRFDTTRDEENIPLDFVPGIGGFIDGFEQGVIGIRVSGRRRLIIPPTLGFGSEPRRDRAGNIIVPANSTLIYDIELVQLFER
jgi:peptidylprolyl isomerase